MPELVEAVGALEDIGVDALIIQDLGVYHLVREHFPSLELHASTQLSVHNGTGAGVLGRLGFRRVVSHHHTKANHWMLTGYGAGV